MGAVVRSGMYRLLIVDDEDDIRRGLADFFPWEEIGFRVVGTTVAAEADLRATDVAMEVDFQFKGHLPVKSSEPHPPRDLAGCGVIQLAFQQISIGSPCHLNHLRFY